MKNKKYEFVAKTPEEAIDNALKSLNCSLEDLDIEIEEQSAKGIFGFLKPKDIKIIASYRDGRDSKNKDNLNLEKNKEVVTDSKIVSKKQDLQDEADVSVENKVKVGKFALEFLEKLIQSMKMDVDFEMIESDDEIKINLLGKDAASLIGRRGSTLDSLQYLTGLVVSKSSDEYKRIILDSSNYRDQREKTLIELANRIAKKVTKTKRSVSLEPMNPYERQIIHSSLQSNDRVTTKSEGVDPYRKIIVSPKR